MCHLPLCATCFAYLILIDLIILLIFGEEYNLLYIVLNYMILFSLMLHPFPRFSLLSTLFLYFLPQSLFLE
jgi:hypothetical protein